jgi:hypothetical protein
MGFGGGLAVGLAIGPGGAGGQTPPNGSAEYPWQATGANVAAVQAALAALSASDGDLAWAAVTGGWSGTLEYDATDDAWYAPNGGDGSELAAYWVTGTGQDGIEALASAQPGDFAVIGRGTGSPQTLRGLGGTYSGTGLPVSCWVTSETYTIGTPSLVYAIDRMDPSRGLGGWTETVAAGGAVDWDTTVADRVAVKAGAGADSYAVASGSAPAAATMAVIAERVAVDGAAAAGSATQVRVNSSTGNFVFLIGAGGASAPGADTTNWWYFNGSGVATATTITHGTERRLECLYTGLGGTPDLTVWVDGAATPTLDNVASAISSSSANPGQVYAAKQTTARTLQFRRVHFVYWS